MDTAARDAAAGRAHLLPLLGICEEDVTKLCLVMPLKAGGSLADHIGHPEGKLTTGRLRVAAALDASRGGGAALAER